MANTIDLFSVRTMLRPFEQEFEPKSFLLRTFFKNRTVFDTETVDIDLVSGTRRMAPFVRPRKMGQGVDRSGYQTKTYKPALLGPQFATTAEDYLKRTPGETIYGHDKTPAQRAAEQLGKDLRELDAMISRREEWMCAQALFNGKVAMYNADEGIDEEVDFGLPSAALTGNDLWTNAASDPVKDLSTWASAMRKASGYSPTVCIMGKKALDAFLDHAKVQAALDNRRIEYGQIKPEELESGVFYAGYLSVIGLNVDILGYEEWGVDDRTGNTVSIVPENKVLLANPNSRNEMLYGAVANVIDGVVAAPRVPFSWVMNDGSARMLRLNSRPLPVPVDVGASFRAAVTA